MACCSKMTDLLKSDHHELDRLLADLFESFSNGDTVKVLGQLDFFWARLAMHIRAEHLHLFPALRAVFDADDARSLIVERLSKDHNFFMTELSAVMKQIRTLTSDSTADGTDVLARIWKRMIRLQKRLKKHNRLEEKQVYLWADTAIAPSETQALMQGISKELNSMPPRFC